MIVDRPRQELACAGCARSLGIEAARWHELIDRVARGYDELEPGRGHQGTELGGRPLDWLYGRKPPACSACGASMPTDDPRALQAGTLRCSACHAERPLEAVPAWLAARHPTLRAVLPARAGSDDGAFYLLFDAPKPADDSAQPSERVPGAMSTETSPPTARIFTLGQTLRTRVGRRAAAGVLALVAVATAAWMLAPSASREADRPSATARPPAPPLQLRKARLHWRASVLRAEGWPLTTGTPCVTALDVVSDGEKLRDTALTIQCGDAELHGARATTPPLECMLFEGPAFDARSHEYDAACKRQAPSDELPRLVFDTRRRRALLTSDNPVYHVELELEREDGELEGPPMFGEGREGELSFAETIMRQGSVTRATGAAQVEVGARCEVALAPTPLSEMPCRVRVRCGARQLYGGFGQGFTRCVLADGSASLALDDGTTAQDGDPRLRVDLPSSKVTLTDAQPDREVRIELDPR